LDSPKSQKQTSELPNHPPSTTVPEELKKNLKEKRPVKRKLLQ
jgi:hypothetical protein